jgi:hypothetical protein
MELTRTTVLALAGAPAPPADEPASPGVMIVIGIFIAVGAVMTLVKWHRGRG